MAPPTPDDHPRFLSSAVGWLFCAFALIAAFFVVAEHRAHLGFLLPYVPLALLGLCIVLHSYMHGRVHGHRSIGDGTHGRHDHSHDEVSSSRDKRNANRPE
jgi:fatty acid desaturase